MPVMALDVFSLWPGRAARAETGPARVAEARHCVSQSHKFVGACMRKSNCQHVCQTEGFPSGECRHHGGILRKCFCTKSC